MSTTKLGRRSGADRYLELVREFPLRPIRSGEVHRRAKRFLRSLAGESDSGARDYRTVLVSLIATYESDAGQRVDTSEVDAATIVRHLLAERSMSVNALSKHVHVAQSALSDMLNGKRDWSRAAIVRVADFFGLERGVFLR